MTDEEINTAVAEAIKELTKQIEKQNQIMQDIWVLMARRM